MQQEKGRNLHDRETAKNGDAKRTNQTNGEEREIGRWYNHFFDFRVERNERGSALIEEIEIRLHEGRSR